MTRLMLSAFALLAGVAIPGCGGANLYSNTDVVEPAGFQLVKASDMERATGGRLQRGVIEYEGKADVVEAFRAYHDAMVGIGWESSSENVQKDRAVGTLRRDVRNCNVEFTRAESGKVKAVIRVAPIP